MFSCINSFRMYNNLLNKSIIKFKNRKLKSVRIFLSGVKIFLAKKVYAIPGVIQTAKIWFQNSFMFVKFPFHGHPRSFHCSGHYYRSILWRSMTKWFLMCTWPIVNCTGWCSKFEQSGTIPFKSGTTFHATQFKGGTTLHCAVQRWNIHERYHWITIQRWNYTWTDAVRR